MKKLLAIVVLGLLLSGNVFAKTGKGELKLSQSTMENLMLYMYGASNPKYYGGANKKNEPMVMAISADGKSSHYYYCPDSPCSNDNYAYRAIKRCEKISNGSPCYLFVSKRRRIKWKNSINTKSTNIPKKLLKEPYEIARIIQDLGFYDKDISQLPGIDYATAKLDHSIKITGKEDNFDYPSLIAKQKSVHKNNWKDYVLGGTKKYKAWAMAITNTKNDMTFGWQTDDTSWNDVIKKAFNGCNKHLKSGKNKHPDSSICILYYKGTTPTTDNEKIETAKKYYNQREVENFFERYPYILNDSNNSLLKKSKITKKTTQSSGIVSELKDLKELLDSGVLTKEEFEKVKKKLLN